MCVDSPRNSRPQAAADSRIRRRIFLRRKFAEKSSASRIRCRILSAENPPKKYVYSNNKVKSTLD